MTTQLLLLLLATLTAPSAAYTAHQAFCTSRNVVKANILPPGTIAELGLPSYLPALPAHHRRFEIEIEEVFRSNLDPFLLAFVVQGSKYHAISKDTEENADADGCDFYQREPYTDQTVTALLHFDNWNNMVIKRSCKGWDEVSEFEKNALREEKYDCACEVEQCYDRVAGRRGLPSCEERRDLESMFCGRDDAGDCIWKGAKRTCVNPVSNMLGRKSYFRGRHRKLK
ncbi:hypothetical protein ACHWQZ_G019428 [Mnemiopsis leidyi]